MNPRHGQWMAYTCPYYQLCYNSIIYSTILLKKNICCITLSICLIILILFLECAGMYMYLFLLLLLRAVTSQSRALSMCFLLRQPPHPPPLSRSRTPEASWTRTRTRTWTSTPPPFLARQLGKEKLSPQVRLHPPCSAALLPRGALSQSEFCRCRLPEPHHLLRVL